MKRKIHWHTAVLGVATCLLVASCNGEDAVDISAQPIGGNNKALDPPTLTAGSATQTTIPVQVCAGASGAPAGFTIQWIDYATYSVQGFTDATCDASCSGVPQDSTYSLGSNECVTVDIGNLSASEVGVSFSCNTLTCGTEYAFRAFAHANATYKKSAFSDPLFAWTLRCSEGCTYTQGYWKNHMASWPVGAMTLGTVLYDKSDLLAIFGQAPAGNGLVTLAHQLIAAKLNVASGADPSSIQVAIDAADVLIGWRVVPPMGNGYIAPAATGALVGALDAYNQGVTGPGHCE